MYWEISFSAICSLPLITNPTRFPTPLFAQAEAAPSPHAATALLFMPRLSCPDFNLFTTTLYKTLCCASRVPAHFSLRHPIALHWTPAFDWTSLPIKSPPFRHCLTLLFLSSSSFDHVAGETEVKTLMGVECIFSPSACFPICFVFISSIFLAGHQWRIPPCSHLHFWREVRLDLLRTLWAGYLLPAHHESIIQLCRKSCTVNKYIILSLTAAPHKQTQWLNNSTNVFRHTEAVATATLYIKTLDTCCRIKNVTSAEYVKTVPFVSSVSSEVASKTQNTLQKILTDLFARLNTWQNKP